MTALTILWENTVRGAGLLGEYGLAYWLDTGCTDYRSDLTIAAAMFVRWHQENYFKYARQHYGLDRLVEHGTSPLSTDGGTATNRCHSGIAHIRWDSTLIVQHLVRWVDAVRKGKPDLRSINFPAEFVPGASIGPVWVRRSTETTHGEEGDGNGRMAGRVCEGRENPVDCHCKRCPGCSLLAVTTQQLQRTAQR